MIIRFTEVLIVLVLAIISALPVEEAVVSVRATAVITSVEAKDAGAEAKPSGQSSEAPAQKLKTDASGIDGAIVESGVDSPVDPALLAAGRQIYLDNYCGVCHALAAVDAGGLFGPPHDHIASVSLERIADASYQGNATTAQEYIRESILEPLIYTAPGSMIAHQQMPPYTHLPAEEIDVLVLFLVQQR